VRDLEAIVARAAEGAGSASNSDRPGNNAINGGLSCSIQIAHQGFDWFIGRCFLSSSWQQALSEFERHSSRFWRRWMRLRISGPSPNYRIKLELRIKLSTKVTHRKSQAETRKSRRHHYGGRHKFPPPCHGKPVYASKDFSKLLLAVNNTL
jgi:hypothetical protein